MTLQLESKNIFCKFGIKICICTNGVHNLTPEATWIQSDNIFFLANKVLKSGANQLVQIKISGTYKKLHMQLQTWQYFQRDVCILKSYDGMIKVAGNFFS